MKVYVTFSSLKLEFHYPYGIYDISVPMGAFRSPQEPDLDIIFVHGLDGSAVSTWTNKEKKFWGVDFLANDLREYGYYCRILSSKFFVIVTSS